MSLLGRTLKVRLGIRFSLSLLLISAVINIVIWISTCLQEFMTLLL